MNMQSHDVIQPVLSHCQRKYVFTLRKALKDLSLTALVAVLQVGVETIDTLQIEVLADLESLL